MPPPLAFGPFILDTDARQLLREPAQPVHLSRKAFDLLCVLVAERPKVLTKAELHEHLWPSTFVSEATLASLVRELRTALGEHGRDGSYIRTVHGFGYAFAAAASQTGATAVQRPTTHWIVLNGRAHPLDDGEHVIGRDAGVAIELRSPTVSRRHARVTVAEGIATLEDLGSKNGTSVDGSAVTSPVPLTDGQRIRIGSYELVFRTTEGSTVTG
jgi:DNA-binding winged helix-turn-helix (wHTH) protein